MTSRYIKLAAAVAAILILPASLFAQGERRQVPSPLSQSTPKSNAAIDLIGNWVSIVTEDWRFRMVTPTKGDYWGVPMNPAARKVADAWDPIGDEASGNQCKSYGAPAFMRLAGHFRFSWEDDQTLKLESDSGTQTRFLRFQASTAPPMRSWQGSSVAQWERQGGPGARAPANGANAGGWLKVTTTNLLAGYLRKNGVPYSENTILTEYFDFLQEPNGPPLLAVTTIVEDPAFLTQPFVVSSQFKKQADAKGWEATSCSAIW